MVIPFSIHFFANNKKIFVTAFLILTILIVLGLYVHPLRFIAIAGKDQNKTVSYVQNSPKTRPINLNKIIILTFGDISQTQYTNAKPILDKYGFKGSFFVTCNWVGTVDDDKSSRMSWQEIQLLHSQGHDVESKAMSHRDLNGLPYKDLEFEISQSKKCLADHAIRATIFAVPHGDAWNNSTIINEISKYYNLADNGFAHLMYLHCRGYERAPNQIDCKTYNERGELNFINRYSIREQSHNAWDQDYAYNDTLIFSKFVNDVNSQTRYNTNDTINAIPIMAYHAIDNSRRPFSTDIGLFETEMRYLHDNGFNVITMDKIQYDPNTNYLYINQTAINQTNNTQNYSLK